MLWASKINYFTRVETMNHLYIITATRCYSKLSVASDIIKIVNPKYKVKRQFMNLEINVIY